MKLNYILLFIILSTSNLLSQNFKIIKILNTNTFQLNNGQNITIYGLNIPSINDSDSIYKSVAKEVLNWEKEILLNKEFFIELINSDSKINITKIYKTYATGKQDIAKLFLIKGYASLKNNNVDFNEYSSFQEVAIKEQIGIWKKINPTKKEELVKELKESRQIEIKNLSNPKAKNY